jgi:hypothetical protein
MAAVKGNPAARNETGYIFSLSDGAEEVYAVVTEGCRDGDFKFLNAQFEFLRSDFGRARGSELQSFKASEETGSPLKL